MFSRDETAMNIASMIERDLCFIENLKQAPGKKIAGTKRMKVTCI